MVGALLNGELRVDIDVERLFDEPPGFPRLREFRAEGGSEVC